VYAETSNSDKGSDEIAELMKRISSLDERIKSLEKRLEDVTMMAFTRPGGPNAPDFTTPVIQPRQQFLQRGSLRHEFNGIPFYIVPAKNSTK